MKESCMINPKTYLRQVVNINKTIQLNRERLIELHEMSKSIPGMRYDSDKVQTSKSQGAGFENQIGSIVELENLIRSEIDEAVKIESDIRKTIEELDTNTERYILTARYLHNMPLNEIADNLDLSLQSINKYHSSALEKVSDIINI